MALFESRKPEATQAERAGKRVRTSRRPVDSVEDMRRRARHRLIGACLLVLVAMVAFPMMFDADPRPEAIDAQVRVAGGDVAPVRGQGNQVAVLVPTPITNYGLADGEEVIDTTAPAPAPAKPAAETQAKPAAVSLAAQRAQQARQQRAQAEAEKTQPSNKPAEKTAAKPAEKPAAKTTEKATDKATEKAGEKTTTASKSSDKSANKTSTGRSATKPAETSAAKTAAKTEKPADKSTEKPAEKSTEKPAEKKPATTTAAATQPPPPAKPSPKTNANQDDSARARALLEGRSEAPTRFIVQVGAFSDDAKVREVRQKIEGLGLRTYIQVVESGGNRAIRVRVGPFTDRGEADRAASRIKGASLPAAILSL